MEKTDPQIIRHRPRSFRDVHNARCGAKRDLYNHIIVSNRGINCPECIALQAKYRARAKTELEAIEANVRKGPLRKPLASSTAPKKRYCLP